MKLIKRFVRGAIKEEVDSELAFHIDMTVRDLVARGMSEQQARAEAQRRFGDATTVTAECRRFGEERDRVARRTEYLTELRQDVAFAVRQLVKTPGFTIVSVLTLALGIGATAAMFSALDAVVLRSLPFPNASRIVDIHPHQAGRRNLGLTPPEYLAFRNIKELEYVAVARLGGGAALQIGDLPEMVDAAAVSADYFAVFGVRPEFGRTFTRDEDVEGGPGVAILSHRFWMSRFNGDPAVLNRVLQIDGKPHTVIGIMPASFDFLKGSANIWEPLALAPAAATQYGAHYLEGYARLRAGVSQAVASAALLSAEHAVAAQIPERTQSLSAYEIQIRSFSDDLVHDYRALLFILVGAVGFVLLIACGNVANLLLARGMSRARELAIRAALGAGRGRLFRQLLTESLVLSLVGAAAGLFVAFILLRALPHISPDDVPRLERAHIDLRVLGMTLLLGIASSVIFGLVPALRAARPQLQQTLREGGRGSGSARDRLRAILVGAQVALTLALLVGAGLLIRSAWSIQHVDPGFDPHGVLAARIVLPEVHYASGDAVVRTYTTIRDEAARIPGVQSVALTSVVPMSNSTMRSSVAPGGAGKSDSREDANLRLVSDGYFSTMRIPMIAGRDISRDDLADGVPVAVVNEVIIHTLWPGIDVRDAIGRRIGAVPTRRKDLPEWEIVGVTKDLHEAALTQTPDPEMYVPYQQTADAFWPFLGRSLVVVARLADEHAAPETLVRPLQRVIAHVDPSLPIADSKSVEGYLSDSVATARMNTILLSLLGGIALVLAMVGIFGVVAYFVRQRTYEIGVRLALGATPSDVWRFVVRRGMAPVVGGMVAGIGLSLATSALLRGQLFGVTAHDPATLGVVASLMAAVALLAIYVPARRAARVPPAIALTST
ncbi:MAG TPA: ABC transporter permease [Gemmatimonadaceae bacterium]|jgi:predicted permease